MALTAQNWSVVIIGRWNPFIMTAAGIAKRVFNLPKGAPIEVQVPLDAIAPQRVRHQDLKVTAVANAEKLQLDLDEASYDLLGEVRSMGVRAMRSLPDTPFLAAGYNIRFRGKQPSERQLIALESALGTNLSTLGLPIVSRLVSCSLAWKDGQINVQVSRGDKEVDIVLNFHRASAKIEDLIAWLEIPTSDLQAKVSGILGQLSIEEEVQYESDSGE